MLAQLVKQLYNAGTPSSKKNQIQELLTSLQRSSQGWNYATSLLKSGDANVQFFGALTFATKVKNDWYNATPPFH